MIPLRHPDNYASVEAYKSVLQKFKNTLVRKLAVAMRYDLDSKEILELLKYIRIMYFYADSEENAILKEIFVPTNDEVPVIEEVGPFLLVDEAHFLLIDETHKLLI